MRSICYISGTRADFGLMRRTLLSIAATPGLTAQVLATGMHLVPECGDTIREIEASGLAILDRVKVDLLEGSGASMAKGIGLMLQRFVDILSQRRPDLVLLLGDRGEMLAGAIAAIHLNLPVVHIHGGERSGTVDEPVRHAISKLAHFHFVATENARERLLKMGELPEHVFVTGAPGLDDIADASLIGRAQLVREAGLDSDRRIALFAFHPVLQEAERAGEEASYLLDSLLARGLQVVAVLPNLDAGSAGVRAAIESRAGHPQLLARAHFDRARFLSWMAAADVMVGNSSAGIIEAASFGTPVINIGSRQNLRERNANVTDVAAASQGFEHALDNALTHDRLPPQNIYGDGQTAPRIAALLADIPLTPDALRKSNAY